jgi:hypothetical protein
MRRALAFDFGSARDATVYVADHLLDEDARLDVRR